MKIERERYDELLSSEITLTQVMRAYNELGEWDFYRQCEYLWGKPKFADKALDKASLETDVLRRVAGRKKTERTLEDAPC